MTQLGPQNWNHFSDPIEMVHDVHVLVWLLDHHPSHWGPSLLESRWEHRLKPGGTEEAISRWASRLKKWEVATEVSRASVITVLTASSHPGLLPCSVAKFCPTLCKPTDCSTSGFSVCHCLWSLLKLMSVESTMPSHHLTLCCPLLIQLECNPLFSLSIADFSPGK